MLDQLRAYAPVLAVQGNVETVEVIRTIPIKREFVVGGCLIGMTHILGQRRTYRETARREFPDARVVIFGHSHKPLIDDTPGLLLLNPGSSTDRRAAPHLHYRLSHD